MVKIQLEIPEELDTNLQHLKIDLKLQTKKEAILRVLNDFFNSKGYTLITEESVLKRKEIAQTGENEGDKK